MTEAIIVALITGGVSLIGMVLTLRASADKQSNEITTQIALINKDINNLAQTVSVHNNYASRMPLVEQKIQASEARIKVIETRLNELASDK